MKKRLASAVTGVITLVTAGGLLVAGATSAAASNPTPPWEPDPSAAAPFGSLVFYDASGHVLTGGTDLHHLFDYVAATTPVTSGADAGSTKATLYFALPDHTKVVTGTSTPDPSQWSTQQESNSTTFPNTAAPAPISGTAATNPSGSAFTNPLVSAPTADLGAFIAGNTVDTTSGYANIYQVRLYDSGPGGASSGTNYWETDVIVSGSTWSVDYPSVTVPTVSLSGTPSGSTTSTTPTRVDTGTSITLSSTVSPAANGTVQFYNGSTKVGSAHPVTTSSATVTQADTPTGNTDYTAVFTPTGGTLVSDATSTTHQYYKVANIVTTTTALSSGNASVNQFSGNTWTATVSAANASTTTAGEVGSVDFTATPTDSTGTPTGGAPTDLGTVTAHSPNATDATKTDYVKSVSSIALAPGYYNIQAVYTPGDTSTYGSSSSSPVAFQVTQRSCPGVDASQDPSSPYYGAAAGTFPTCQDTQTIRVTVTPGSLTISTPYTAANPLVLPVMKLNSAGTLLSTSSPFPAPDSTGHAQYITVTSTLAGDPAWTVSCTDTDLHGAGSNLINGDNVGLTNGALANPTGGTITPAYPRTPAFTDIAAANGVTANTGTGMKDGPQTFAKSNNTGSTSGGNGTAQMTGTLTINAPTQTPADTYTGTITFSVA